MLAAIVSVVSALIVYWLNRRVKQEADKAAKTTGAPVMVISPRDGSVS